MKHLPRERRVVKRRKLSRMKAMVKFCRRFLLFVKRKLKQQRFLYEKYQVKKRLKDKIPTTFSKLKKLPSFSSDEEVEETPTAREELESEEEVMDIDSEEVLDIEVDSEQMSEVEEVEKIVVERVKPKKIPTLLKATAHTPVVSKLFDMKKVSQAPRVYKTLLKPMPKKTQYVLSDVSEDQAVEGDGGGDEEEIVDDSATGEEDEDIVDDDIDSENEEEDDGEVPLEELSQFSRDKRLMAIQSEEEVVAKKGKLMKRR